MFNKKEQKKGFSLIEILVVITIIGVLATFVGVALFGARSKAGDTKRINDLSQIGRFLSFGCLMPTGGAGEYDLNDLVDEYKVKYPQYVDKIPSNIKDPKSGTDNVSNYKYIIDENNNCVLYANLEKEDEKVTLSSISEPTPKGGRGVFQGTSVGWNGTNKYFQISN